MTLVAGVDSSTQSCKVVSATRRPASWSGRAGRPHPDGTEVHPDGLVGGAAGGDRRRPAGWTTWPRSRSPASSTAWSASTRTARWCGRRCCGTTPARRRAAADLIDELAAVPARPGPRRSAACRWPASRSPSCAGWPTHEPENAARTAAVCLPHDWLTWKLAGADGLDALRTDRGDASGTGTGRRATGEYRPDLLERALRPASCAAARACSVRPSAAGRAADRRAARPGHRRQRRRRARRRRAPGRRGGLDRHLRHGVRGRRRRPAPTRAARWPVSPTPPAGSCRWSCTLNAARVLDAAAATARGRPRRARRAGALRAAPAPDGLVAGALPGGRAHAEPAATPPARCTA